MIRNSSLGAHALQFGALGVALALAACSDKDVRAYRAPKDPGVSSLPAPSGQSAPASELTQGQSDAPALVWQVPAGWRPKPGDAVHRASYAIDKSDSAAEVAITVFPGDAGGILANVNRWRGQAGLPPVDEAGLAGATSALDGGGIRFIVVDAAGGSRRIVAAMLPRQGSTWFFKLTGDNQAVEGAKAAFLAFLKTVRAPSP